LSKNTEGKNQNRFDLIIVGTGVAASTIAYECASKGWKVAIIDSRPFGGTCALRGCDPKKVLVAALRTTNITNSGSCRPTAAESCCTKAERNGI
jgi:pyruvate/2-oxoglutarate dehydrogenase complex dihydrolipoamide dehydrogenase (E3) component